MKKLIAAVALAMCFILNAQVPAKVRCSECKGKKTFQVEEVCMQCGGRGFLCNVFGDYTAKCPTCSKNMIANTMTWRGRVRTIGSGKVKKTVNCHVCKGEGWIENESDVKILKMSKSQWKKVNMIIDINGEVELKKSKIKIVIEDDEKQPEQKI